jgi:hypothetical protein
MDNTDEDQAAMVAMKTEIEAVVKRVGGDMNVAAKSGKKGSNSKSPAKRGRKKVEGNEGSGDETHGH